jgi:ribosome-binding factor A
MQESKRQKQVAKQIYDELTTIFIKEGLNMMDGGLVSIANVYVTPDLLETRISLSLFQVADKNVTLQKIQEKSSQIRGILGNKLRHQLRRIPTITFQLDETLDYVFKMEEIFKNLNNDKPTDDIES